MKMDKTYAKIKTFEEADNNVDYWLSKTPAERFWGALRHSLRVYGYDPDDPPRMDKSHFEIRKRK